MRRTRLLERVFDRMRGAVILVSRIKIGALRQRLQNLLRPRLPRLLSLFLGTVNEKLIRVSERITNERVEKRMRRMTGLVSGVLVGMRDR